IATATSCDATLSLSTEMFDTPGGGRKTLSGIWKFERRARLAILLDETPLPRFSSSATLSGVSIEL
ncbi:MAG: hypothetical protein OXD31_12005, partial [Chloroflexi bacterium]|nr:hypothetical protein [Chloroflexota bacterium]